MARPPRTIRPATAVQEPLCEDAVDFTQQSPSTTKVGIAFGILIVSAALVNPLAMTALLSVLPAISAHFTHVPYAPVLVRGLVSIVAISLVIAAPLAAVMADRFGSRRVLLVSAASFVVAGTCGYFVSDLWLLLASRTILGVADAFIGTLIIAQMATRLEPRLRARWIGWYTFAASAGAFVIIPLSGYMGRTGWHNVFLIYLLALPILFSAALTVKPDAPHRRSATQSSRVYTDDNRRWLARLPFALITVGIVSGAIENTTHVFLPFHLVELGENSPPRIAQAVLPIAIGGAASAFCYGFLRERMSTAKIFVLSFAWGGISLIWIGQVAAYPMIIVAGVSLGLGVGLLAPNANALAAEDGRHEPAQAIGFVRGAFFAGSPVAQFMLEPVASAAGAGSAITVLGLVSLVLAGVSLIRARQPTAGREGFSAGQSVDRSPAPNLES